MASSAIGEIRGSVSIQAYGDLVASNDSRRNQLLMSDWFRLKIGRAIRRAGREAQRQQIRTWAAVGGLAEDARQSGAGVRHRGLDPIAEEL